MTIPEMIKACDDLTKHLEKQMAELQNQLGQLEDQLNAAREFAHSLKNGGAKGRSHIPAHSKPVKAVHRPHAAATNGITHRNYVRDLLRKHKADGLIAREIRQFARKDGRPIPSAFPYEQLNLLQRDGEARREGDKYYPVSQNKTASAA